MSGSFSWHFLDVQMFIDLFEAVAHHFLAGCPPIPQCSIPCPAISVENGGSNSTRVIYTVIYQRISGRSVHLHHPDVSWPSPTTDVSWPGTAGGRAGAAKDGGAETGRSRIDAVADRRGRGSTRCAMAMRPWSKPTVWGVRLGGSFNATVDQAESLTG